MQKEITRDDILDIESYGRDRRDHRQSFRAIKEHRRVDVGPYVSFYFENRQTMWHQIHEMLYIEKGGEDQIADELDAYNPLIPQGRDLTATMMIEIEDPVRRDAMLARLGWIDEKVFLVVGDQRIAAQPFKDSERNTPDGKTSAVHFLKFPFTDGEVALFRDTATKVSLDIEHENYSHSATLSAATCQSLAGDLD